MVFLWQLLPGAREARNQVIIGYAWLFAIGLLAGVPVPVPGSPLDQLVEAAGPIGVGIASGFVAFLLGSVSDDAFEGLLRQRGGRALTRLSARRPSVIAVRRMEEWGVRAETERLEASIDRLNAEILLRMGLMVPALAVGGVGVGAGSNWGWAGCATAVVLTIQVGIRRGEYTANLARSAQLAQSMEAELERDPVVQDQLREEAERSRTEQQTRATGFPSLSPDEQAQLEARLATAGVEYRENLDRLDNADLKTLSRREATRYLGSLHRESAIETRVAELWREYRSVIEDLQRQLNP